ncbi:Serine/threonine-protein phosphatase pgam5, mitochondrial [Homalodisca vitripennis]|nr:Serine/threonine-protein phosphatase pgam5, mitochondrial [Homalodisca vitripennis]
MIEEYINNQIFYGDKRGMISYPGKKKLSSNTKSYTNCCCHELPDTACGNLVSWLRRAIVSYRHHHTLTPEVGTEQAFLTGKRLQEFGHKYTHLIVSTMTRAKETAALIQESLPNNLKVIHCPLLEEGAPIPPEPPLGDYRPEACQFFEDGARIEAAFRRHIHRADPRQKEDSYEIIVCHANVIRYFICRALQVPSEAWLRMSLHHASITAMTILPSGRVVLRTVSDSGHLPAQLVTTS